MVDRASMSRIDPWASENWIVERHGYEADAGVYHTVYFYDPTLAPWAPRIFPAGMWCGSTSTRGRWLAGRSD